MDEDDGGHGRMQELRRETAELVRAAAGDEAAVADAVRLFIEESWELVQSPSAMWDYFAISSPTVPRMAGLAPEAADGVVKVFETLMNRFVAMLGRDEVYERPFPAGWAERDD